MTNTLYELERLHAESTPGEWEHEDVRNYGWEVNCDEQESHIASCGLGSLSEANAAAIVALHNAFPALLALLRAYEVMEKDMRAISALPVGAYDSGSRAAIWADASLRALDAARAKLNGGK